MQYRQIAKEMGDIVAKDKHGIEHVVKAGGVRFAEMEYGKNTDFCKSLGVEKLPSVYFYSKNQKVDAFPCGPKKLPLLLEKLASYGSMSPAELAFEAEMNRGARLANSVLETLQQEKKKAPSDEPSDQKELNGEAFL